MSYKQRKVRLNKGLPLSLSLSLSMGIMGEERRTLVLINLASIMERADEALLPAVYNELGAALHTTPTGLGSLTLYRSIVQALCYPLAAYMASRYNRAHVIALGAFLWAFATFLVAISTTFIQVAISRGLNGIGLALVIPAIQSIVADSTDDATRGSAFGWLGFTGCMGSIIGGFFSIMLASTTFFGIAGWRIAFHLVAIISAIVGFFVWHFAVDPHFVNGMNMILGDQVDVAKSAWEDAKELIKEAKDVMKIRSFQIFVAQGIAGSFPWCALSFVPMWFELIGFSHEYTAFLMTLFSIATSIGALFGGKMGDFLARHLPNAGRIILSQISTGFVIPLSAILLLGLKDDPTTGVSHAIAIFVMGLIISWNDAATNSPIFAEIVQEKSRTSIYALDRSFESILASFAPPVVGILAEHMYGYKLGDNNKSEDPKINRENAMSLAKALYTSISIPMLICTSIYSFLYCSYPRDRDRARTDTLIASETQQIELERKNYQFGNFDLGDDNEEMRVIDLDNGEEESQTEKLLANKF